MTLKEAVKKLGKKEGTLTRKAWYRGEDYDCIEPERYEWNDIDLSLEDALANDWEVKLKKTVYYFIAIKNDHTTSFSTLDNKTYRKRMKEVEKWGYKIILEGSEEI
jgi:hypothetical protein